MDCWISGLVDESGQWVKYASASSNGAFFPLTLPSPHGRENYFGAFIERSVVKDSMQRRIG